MKPRTKGRKYPGQHTVKDPFKLIHNYWRHKNTGEIVICSFKPNRNYERISKTQAEQLTLDTEK